MEFTSKPPGRLYYVTLVPQRFTIAGVTKEYPAAQEIDARLLPYELVKRLVSTGYLMRVYEPPNIVSTAESIQPVLAPVGAKKAKNGA